MKRILIFIFPLLIIIAAALTVFGVLQVRFEQDKLTDDLKRKTKHIAETMELSVRFILKREDLQSAQYLVQKFEGRERLQGCALYDRNGDIIAVTKRFSDWGDKSKLYLADIIQSKTPRGETRHYKEYIIYSYVLPIIDEAGELLGLAEVIQDTSYILTRLAELWRRLSVTLIVLVLLIAATALLISRQIFVLPVKRLTEWFLHFQKGDLDAEHPIKDTGAFGKLACEVEQVALSLRVARRSISCAAEKRLEKEESWTETKLRDLIHAKVGDNAFFVVSNREPYMHVVDDVSGAVRCIRPASGVVTAIHPVLCACGGTWVAHGSGSADRKFVNSKDKLGVPPDDNRYILKRIWLSKTEEDGYYYGFSNEGLWPLCHNTHTRPIFRASDWQQYKLVNQKFADAIIAELPKKNAFIFIQDYHFTPYRLPRPESLQQFSRYGKSAA